MLLFGHLGITLGAAALAAGVNDRFRIVALKRVREDVETSTDIGTGQRRTFWNVDYWFTSLNRHVDIRAVFLGSLLPDIIDKPVGHGLLAASLNNGRIFSHSLVFFLLVLLVGLFLYRRNGNTAFLGISYGVLMHLLLDSMWVDPHALFWPFEGIGFEKGAPGNFFEGLLESVRKASSYVPEIIGFAILGVFGLWLIWRRALWRFIWTGRIG